MSKNKKQDKDWEIKRDLGDLGCLSINCEQNLHCFLRNLAKKGNRGKNYRSETCTGCGADLVNWNRIDKHNLADKEYFIKCLNKETWRHAVWNLNIPDYMIEKALKRSYDEMHQRVKKIISTRINKRKDENYWDSRQTPRGKDIIFLAQHATGTCCRRCIEEWYGIDKNTIMREEEIDFLTEITMAYIRSKINLRDQPKD